jgi:hypothetical protein
MTRQSTGVVSSSSIRCCVTFLFTLLQHRVRFEKGTNVHSFIPLVLVSFYLQVFFSVSRSLRDDTANVVAWYCLIFGLSINNMSCFFIFRFSISLTLKTYTCALIRNSVSFSDNLGSILVQTGHSEVSFGFTKKSLRVLPSSVTFYYNENARCQ